MTAIHLSHLPKGSKMDINYNLHGQLILITWHKPDKKKNQLLPDNETEQKRNATGLTDTEQSTEIMTRDDNSYGPESAWDIYRLTCMDNTPTNGNFNDEHRHPWKLTTTQDYNKHMLTRGTGWWSYMTPCWTQPGGGEKEKGEKKEVPPHLDLTIPNSSSSCLPVGWKLLIEIFLELVLMHKVTERDASLPHHNNSCFGKVTCPKTT